ncbi:MAG TPA: hypothetical protein VNS79_13535 [Sphingobium sp.]|nr:hypothetical protein [Sphingobium sp.]
MASSIEPDGDEIAAAGARKPSRSRLVVALTLLVVIGVLAVLVWAFLNRNDRLPWSDLVSGPVAQTGLNGASNATDPTGTTPVSAALARAPAQPLNGDQQAVRMLDLEQRLTRVAVAAQSASGYANRAEAMMIAFAARRALDSGAPLGYVEGQLRLLFGDAQPKAVATIVNAAAEPVTISDLRAGLDRIATAEAQGAPDESWWSALVDELRDLAVIRAAGTPPPAPEQRIARARLYVESGQIERAIGEVSALRQQADSVRWLEQARRYNEAHRALDVIEAAAILEPRMAPPAMPAPEAAGQR